MKRCMILCLCIFCIMTTGCRTALDVSRNIAERYKTPLQATIHVSTVSGIACDYQLYCVVDNETSSVEIQKPESVAGIKATIHSQSCKIEYENLTLDSMMLNMRGMTPADCFDQTIYCLRNEVPIHYSYEDKGETACICLTFEDTESGYTVKRQVWLNEKSMEILEAEYYLNDVLVMRMYVEELSFTE